MDQNTPLPVIAGVEITTDDEGRFNLNALHRAAGGLPKQAPALWKANKSTQELIDQAQQTIGNPIVSYEGRNGGTFAHELLAVSYASWISPAFQLQVNQTFLDYKDGRLVPSSTPAKLSRLEILQLAMDAEKENGQLKEKIEQDKPKVEFHDSVIASDREISVAEAAKILGTGERRLFYFLREYGYLISQGEQKNLPYQRYQDQGLFRVRPGSFMHPTHGKTATERTMVTGKGLVRLGKHLREIEIRQSLEHGLASRAQLECQA